VPPPPHARMVLREKDARGEKKEEGEKVRMKATFYG
jgi:hypothetical protein